MAICSGTTKHVRVRVRVRVRVPVRVRVCVCVGGVTPSCMCELIVIDACLS